MYLSNNTIICKNNWSNHIKKFIPLAEMVNYYDYNNYYYSSNK